MASRSVLKLDKSKNADCLVTIIPEQQHASFNEDTSIEEKINNAISQNEFELIGVRGSKVSLSGERGWTASLWLVGESRMLYVRA